jgi:Family of unknown function (DUF5926)/SEC-C motif
MGKSSRGRASTAKKSEWAEVHDSDVAVVGQRVPCPCGSGRKYKQCHGRARTTAAAVVLGRPFEGLPSEPDWVALREVVPAATVTVRLLPDYRLIAAAEAPAIDEVTVATVLPLAWPALRRGDGAVFLGLQTSGGTGDPSRDLAAALTAALAAEPASPITFADLPPPGPRLQDVVDPAGAFDVTVHDGFDFWVEGAEDLDPQVSRSLERANEAVIPTRRLTGVDAAYWCRIGDRTHLRWVLPHAEDELLDAVARLHAAGASGLGDRTRYVGAFRAHGLLVPVWDLPLGCSAEDVEGPAAEFAVRLIEALAETTPLTYDERRARAGVVSRQLTLR